MDNAVVSEHYNERRDEGQRGRTESPIIGMRNFNNWVKSVLIAAHTRPGYHVLDLCSGKGGDLNKWSKALCTKYVACDTAGVSIQQVMFVRARDLSFKATKRNDPHSSSPIPLTSALFSRAWLWLR